MLIAHAAVIWGKFTSIEVTLAPDRGRSITPQLRQLKDGSAADEKKRRMARGYSPAFYDISNHRLPDAAVSAIMT